MRRVSALILGCCVAGCSSDGEECDVSGFMGEAGEIAFQPRPGISWQWQLSDLPVDTSICAAVYDVDLFTTSEEEIDELREADRAVICYFSAGSFESGRPDSDSFPDEVKGDPLEPPFEDEVWVDIRSPAVLEIMEARLDLAVSKGCDAVEPDNVDGYANENGFELSDSDQLDFNRFLADEAHARGLSVGLKNDLDQLGELVDSFDWALNEECFLYEECNSYIPNFLAQGKAVFHAEYVESVGPDDLDDVCNLTRQLGLSTIMKNIDLDAYRLACPEL
jgi:hypothetical protein